MILVLALLSIGVSLVGVACIRLCRRTPQQRRDGDGAAVVCALLGMMVLALASSRIAAL